MNKVFYAIADMFQWGFDIMFATGMLVNLIFIGLITFFTIYWILQMKRNPEKVRVRR